MPNINDLDAAQNERLTMLVREAGEMLKVTGEIFANGLNSPERGNGSRTQRNALEQCVGGLCSILGLMASSKDINIANVNFHAQNKVSEVLNRNKHQGINDFDAFKM